MRDLLIGLDGGTGGMRAFVFDKQGNVLASADAPTKPSIPKAAGPNSAPKIGGRLSAPACGKPWKRPM